MTQHIHWVASLWRVRALMTVTSLVTVLIGLSGCGITPDAAAQAPAGTPTATIDIPARDATAAVAATAWQSEIETAAARPSATSISIFMPYPTPAPVQFEPGIYEDCESDRVVMTIYNCWADRMGDQIIGASAGLLLAEPAQGVLAVATWNLNMTESSGDEYYETPQLAGAIRIVQASLPYLTVEAENGAQFTFNMTTRQWEVLPPVLSTATPTATITSSPTALPSVTTTPTAPPSATPTSGAAACQLYPIALHTSTLANVPVGTELQDIRNGTQAGAFGWLTWTGNQSTPALARSLTPPGDSATYHNPAASTDHTVSVGDGVVSSSGAHNSRSVRDALDQLKGQSIVVPVWDTTIGKGANLQYHIQGFAQVQLTAYQLSGQSRISAIYQGMVACRP